MLHYYPLDFKQGYKRTKRKTVVPDLFPSFQILPFVLNWLISVLIYCLLELSTRSYRNPFFKLTTTIATVIVRFERLIIRYCHHKTRLQPFRPAFHSP